MKKQNCCDPRRCTRDAAKAQGTGDERNDQKHEGPVQHDQPPNLTERKSLAEANRLNTTNRAKFLSVFNRPRELGGYRIVFPVKGERHGLDIGLIADCLDCHSVRLATIAHYLEK